MAPFRNNRARSTLLITRGRVALIWEFNVSAGAEQLKVGLGLCAISELTITAVIVPKLGRHAYLGA